VKIGKGISENLAPLTLACGKYGMKKPSTLNGISSSREGKRMTKMIHEVGNQKRRGHANVAEYETLCS
jgi:hypothetical protein